MIKILNNTELAAVIAVTPVTEGHAALLTALHNLYPETPFRLIAEADGRGWAPGIIDRAGNRVTNTLGEWVDQELAAAGGNAREVWRRHKNSGLIKSGRVGSMLYLSAPYGAESDAFYQIEILVGPELTTQKLFDPSPMFPPENRNALLSGPCIVFANFEQQILSPSKYEFRALKNVKHFLQRLAENDRANRIEDLPELEKKVISVQEITLGSEGGQTTKVIPFLSFCPGWVDRIAPEVRLFQDWQNSSAGRSGARLCNHWCLEMREWAEKSGRKDFSLIPQWADMDGGLSLPVIFPDYEDSPYSVLESLDEFDRLAGYPFAWYFYMLHNNRVRITAGVVIAKAIQDGLMKPLPECDEKVLLQWEADHYSF